MLRTSPNTYNSHTGNDIIKATSNVCPNNGKGVTELIGESKANSTKHNSPNNEYHILPATKEPKNEYIPLPQRIPYNIGQPKCFKALNEHLKNDFSSEIKLSTKTAIKHHHLCLKDEKHSTATIKQHPENLDELKKCVYDPKQYLQRCIDISVNKQSDDYKIVTPKRLTNAKTQIDNRKNNDLKGNSLNNHNQKLDMKIQQLTSIFGDYAFYGSKRSHTNGSVLTDYINIKSNASKLSQKTRKFRKSSNLKCSSQNVVAVSTKASSSKEKSTLFSMRGSENKSSNEIQDGVSKIVISASNNEKNIVNKHKYKKKRNPYGTEEELILVPIVTSAIITRREGSSENNRNIKKNSSLLKEREEEIMYWLKSLQSHKRKIDGERQSMSEYKWKKSASFNVRKGHTRHGRRNQTLKCIKNNTQALLQPTVTDFKIPISDTYTSSNIKPKNHSNNVTSTEFSSVKYDENSHSSENSLCKEIVFYSESSTLENYIGSENLESQKKNLVHKTELQPTKKLNEELSALHTDLSMEPTLVSNDTQSQNLHMDEIYCTTKLKDKNNCDILNTSVVDTTPQPQLSTVTPILSGEIPLNSSVSSKPPPHPKSAKKRNERMNNSILKNKETQLLLISDLMKTNSDTKPLNIALNCKNSCENKCNFISLAQKSTEHIRSTKSSSSYEHSNSNFFVQTANPTSMLENKNAQLLTEYSSQIAAVDNSATNIQNNESVNTCKKLEGMKTIKDDVRCTWETPGQCLKARNDSQKYRSSLCTGQCSYYDSNIYGRPCSPCRISKAEKCSLKYMESVIGDALNKSHYCRNLSMINSFYKQNQLNTKNVASSMKDPFRMTQSFTVERKIETGNFEMPAKKEQGNKISPLQMLPKHKKKKGTPISLKSISAKNTTVSSPSAEHYTDSCRRNNGHTMLNRKRVNRREKPYDRPVTAFHAKPQTHFSSIACPTVRLLRHHEEYNLKTSSSSSQDDESSNSSKTSEEEAVNIVSTKSATNSTLHNANTSNEVNYLNTTAYDEKTSVEIDRLIRDPILQINNDVDTVTFGKYMFIGVGNHFEASEESVPALTANNALCLKRKYSVIDICESGSVASNVSSITDNSIPYEKSIYHPMKPEDNFKTIKENYESDNDIYPHIKTYTEESPVEKYKTLTSTNEKRSDTQTEEKQENIITSVQEEALDEKVSNSQEEICSVCLSHIARKTLDWLELNLSNTGKTTSSTNRALSTSCASQLQLNTIKCKSQLKRKKSEGSIMGDRDWKMTMKGADNVVTSLNDVPMSFLEPEPVSQNFLKSSENKPSEVLNDLSFSKESSSSMQSNIHESCVKEFIKIIETLLSETDVSGLSDSGSSCKQTQTSFSENFTTPECVSSSSETDNNIISQREQYEKSERNDSSISKCMFKNDAKVIETKCSTLKNLCGESTPDLEIRSNRHHKISEAKNGNKNNYNDNSNNISMVNDKDEDVFQLPKEEHKEIKKNANYKNILKIKVDSNDNNLTLSFISDHKQITSSKGNSSFPLVSCKNSQYSKTTAALKHYFIMNYKIYKAKVLYSIIEEYLCVTWEQAELIECSEKIILDHQRNSTCVTEPINEITVNQLYCLELPLYPLDKQIVSNVATASEDDSKNEQICDAPFHEMLNPVLSSSQIFNNSTNTKSYADVHNDSESHLSISGTSSSSSNIISKTQIIENSYSSSSANVSSLLPSSQVNLFSSNKKSSEILALSIHEDIPNIKDSNNSSIHDLSPNEISIKYQDFKSTAFQQNEEHEVSIQDLTTPDTVHDLIAAFTHIPNGTTIISSTSHTLVEPFQNSFPLNNLEDILEAWTNFSSVVSAEEDSFQSDLSSLENFLERMTSNSTVDSSYEEVEHRHIKGIRHIEQDSKTLETAREFERLQEYYLVTKCSTYELQICSETKELIPNLLNDARNTLTNELCESSVHTNAQSLSLYHADKLSDISDVSVKTLQEEILENYLPDEDTRIMLQSILSEVLEDVVNVDEEFLDAASKRSLQNCCGNTSEKITKFFPPSLENKCISITEIMDQIKESLIVDERIKNKINIIDNIVRKDSVTTHKLVERITSELSLIPREEMELFMAEIFGIDLTTFTLDSLYHDMNKQAELDVQYDTENEIEESSKNSDRTISQTTLDQLNKEISQIEQLLEIVTEKSCNIVGEISKKISRDNLKSLESNCTALISQMHESTIEANESEWTEFYHDSLERLAAASEFTTEFESINDKLEMENVDQGNTLEPTLEENILMLHSVLNAEEQVLSGAGDGIITPRNVIQHHESHFSTWAVLSLEDMVRNTPIHHPLNVQTSSLSVVVSNSVANYRTSSAITSISDLSAPHFHENEEFNTSIKIRQKDSSSNTSMRVNTFENNMETENMQSIECIKMNEESVKMKEISKTNVTVSRRTKAFATVYFILFSLIFGGLAIHSHCQ